MNKRFRRKKKGSRISIIIFIIVVGIFCSYMLISVFSNKVSDIFMSYAESETTKLMTLVINKSVTKQMANSFDDKLLFDIVKDAAGNIKLIDLFGSLGISFFSSSKNFFKPLFISLVVMYVAIYNTAKLTNTTPTLYLIFCLNTSTYRSPISNVCKYSPLTVTAI